jgi:hypothetical protein
MSLSFPTYNRIDLIHLMEPGLPYFLNGFDTDPDDPADWWLDLGSVDLSSVMGM